MKKEIFLTNKHYSPQEDKNRFHNSLFFQYDVQTKELKFIDKCYDEENEYIYELNLGTNALLSTIPLYDEDKQPTNEIPWHNETSQESSDSGDGGDSGDTGDDDDEP